MSGLSLMDIVVAPAIAVLDDHRDQYQRLLQGGKDEDAFWLLRNAIKAAEEDQHPPHSSIVAAKKDLLKGCDSLYRDISRSYYEDVIAYLINDPESTEQAQYMMWRAAQNLYEMCLEDRADKAGIIDEAEDLILKSLELGYCDPDRYFGFNLQNFSTISRLLSGRTLWNELKELSLTTLKRLEDKEASNPGLVLESRLRLAKSLHGLGMHEEALQHVQKNIRVLQNNEVRNNHTISENLGLKEKCLIALHRSNAKPLFAQNPGAGVGTLQDLELSKRSTALRPGKLIKDPELMPAPGSFQHMEGALRQERQGQLAFPASSNTSARQGSRISTLSSGTTSSREVSAKQQAQTVATFNKDLEPDLSPSSGIEPMRDTSTWSPDRIVAQRAPQSKLGIRKIPSFQTLPSHPEDEDEEDMMESRTSDAGIFPLEDVSKEQSRKLDQMPAEATKARILDAQMEPEAQTASVETLANHSSRYSILNSMNQIPQKVLRPMWGKARSVIEGAGHPSSNKDSHALSASVPVLPVDANRLPQPSPSAGFPELTRSSAIAQWFDAKVHHEQDAAAHEADRWLWDISKFPRANALVRQKRNPGRGRKVKVCILDSGLDGSNPLLTACKWESNMGRRIRRYIWYDENDEVVDEQQSWEQWRDSDTRSQGAYTDSVGHGTHCAGLLLQIAPNAEIYIARVGDGSGARPAQVAKAITYAQEKWNIDIITLSLGLPSSYVAFGLKEDYKLVEQAINNLNSKVLVFAAAANHGPGEKYIAFPAEHSKVICVKAAKGDGEAFNGNPTNTTHAGKNFSTLGQAVLSLWRVYDEDNGLRVYQKRMSGTSVATPVLAAITALLLEFLWQPSDGGNEDIRQEIKERLEFDYRTKIQDILQQMSEPKNGCRFVQPWLLLNTDDPTGEKNQVLETILYKCLAL